MSALKRFEYGERMLDFHCLENVSHIIEWHKTSLPLLFLMLLLLPVQWLVSRTINQCVCLHLTKRLVIFE